MVRIPAFVLASALALAVASAQGPASPGHGHWPQWRGPVGTGVAPTADPPIRWSETENLRWKVAIPGRGLSTPIVWDERIFLTTAVPVGELVADPYEDAPGAHDNLPPVRPLAFMVLAVDRRDGRILWRRTVREARPHEGSHVTGSWASASPVTDGERLFVSFGSQGLYALDLEGGQLWQADLGDMRIFHGHGEGSSPALRGDTLVVNWDHQGDSFLVALDARDGSERWRAARDEITSWSTPLIVEHAGRHQVVVSATRRVRGYDLEDGTPLWQAAGLSRNVVASPVAGGGLVFAASSYDRRAMLAIRLSAARGEITGGEAVVWTRGRDTPYVPSLLLAGERLCFVKHLQGVVTCVDAATGATLAGPLRLPGAHGVFASPVAAAGRLYVTSRDGTTAVLDLERDLELLATNRLNDSFSASAAIAGRTLLLRGERHLYCLGGSPGDGI